MNDKFYLKLIYNDQITIEFYIKILNLEQDQVEMSKGSPKSPKINVGSIVHQKNTLEQKVKMLEQEKKDLEKYSSMMMTDFKTGKIQYDYYNLYNNTLESLYNYYIYHYYAK